MKKKVIFQFLILILAVGLTVWLMPRKSDTLEYEVNKPWKYPLLTAPFNIPVYPDTATVRQARDSIARVYVPVYKIDTVANNRMLKDINERIGQMRSLSPGLRASMYARASAIVNAGIVASPVYDQIRSGELSQIRLSKGNSVTQLATDSLRSPRGAYDAFQRRYPVDSIHNLLTALGLHEAFGVNLVLDDETNDRYLSEAYRKVSAARGQIQSGERIIDQGELVSPQIFTVLQTYEQMLAERGGGPNGPAIYGWAGKIAYVLLMFGLLGMYLYFFRQSIFWSVKSFTFVVGLMLAFILLAILMSHLFGSGLYVVPFAMITIVLTVFFDAGMALCVTLLTTLVCATLASSPLEFMAMQCVAGIIAVCGLKEMSRRSQLVRTAGLVFVGYALTYVSINLLLLGSFSGMKPWMFAIMAVNVICISFAYVLIFLFEHWLGFTSMVGLVELSDINHPLLRELSRECPGTFQHSMGVSNLAAEAAAKVGANVQLIRAGALYHDIGKIDNPAFFTENQHGVNPHDVLDPLQSARIITGHVTAGLRRAEKAKLPKVIRDFIAQHHGKGVARYFYITYCNQHPGEEVDRAPFTYAGPNPQTLESSILMMADAVEAASRSLKEYTEEAITDLVNRIVDSQVAEGLHADSPLAFRDVQTIKESFIQRLLTIYHSRIAYPTANK